VSARRALAALLLAACAGPGHAQTLADALDQGDLICEFREGWRRSQIADLLGDPDPVALLVVYEKVTAERAAVLSSRTPGRRPVVVRATGTHVHFIERVGMSLRVTTLTGCARTKWKNGAETCVRFPARYAWHFDTQALVAPDAAYARLPSGASVGACEPWDVD
jgi:hypothetical protein